MPDRKTPPLDTLPQLIVDARKLIEVAKRPELRNTDWQKAFHAAAAKLRKQLHVAAPGVTAQQDAEARNV